MNDCDTCKGKCPTPTANWFPIGMIRYCRPQVMFLLEHIEELREGHYPPNPNGSSYVDPSVPTQPKTYSVWQETAQIAAELDSRLKQVPGILRTLFTMEVEDGKTVHDMKTCRDCGYDYCPSLQVLNYISGWRRRRMTFTDFKSNNKKAAMK